MCCHAAPQQSGRNFNRRNRRREIKKFYSIFFKKLRGLGAEPQGAFRRKRNLFERENSVCGFSCIKVLYFYDCPEKEGLLNFAKVCSWLRPENLPPFEKGGRKLLFCVTAVSFLRSVQLLQHWSEHKRPLILLLHRLPQQPSPYPFYTLAERGRVLLQSPGTYPSGPRNTAHW